ncbi:hypothetical protein [Sphingomonas quercus]|uniref:Proteophosphoglycan ppg4 n=1 Tax=Sphingomonas quercus TaxID=2842451 RepID=A0ABS6BHP8_9SPHN|nr:hypothetical protein [Sphingomonas quercus]MBU3077838.1 hypothetical protein [Sphingomonas quercus]
MRTIDLALVAIAIATPTYALSQGPGSSSMSQPATAPGAAGSQGGIQTGPGASGRADRPDMGPGASTSAQAPAPAGSHSGADTPMQNNSSVGDDRVTDPNTTSHKKSSRPR